MSAKRWVACVVWGFALVVGMVAWAKHFPQHDDDFLVECAMFLGAYLIVRFVD